jgi:hypothetical protein
MGRDTPTMPNLGSAQFTGEVKEFHRFRFRWKFSLAAFVSKEIVSSVPLKSFANLMFAGVPRQNSAIELNKWSFVSHIRIQREREPCTINIYYSVFWL